MRNDRVCAYWMRRNHQALTQRLLASDCVGVSETLKYVIRCVLHTVSRSMQLACCLGGKLRKEKAIGNVCNRAKNQIRSHNNLRTNKSQFPIY